MEGSSIDMLMFQNFVKKHPAALYPAFEMQTKFTSKVMGYKFWENYIKFRSRMFEDKYVPIHIILKMSVNMNLRRASTIPIQNDIVNEVNRPSEETNKKVLKKAESL